MNQERAKELLPIIQAFAEGKEIQALASNEQKWLSISSPNWINSLAYRIKPTKKEGWVQLYKNVHGFFGGCFKYLYNRDRSKNTLSRPYCKASSNL